MVDDFYDHMKKEQELLDMSYKESVRQKRERDKKKKIKKKKDGRTLCRFIHNGTGHEIGWEKNVKLGITVQELNGCS